MTDSYEDILTIREQCMANAPDDNEIDTSDIPILEPGAPSWPAKEHDRFAPVAQWYFRGGWERGYDAAIKDMKDAFNVLIAKRNGGQETLTATKYARERTTP